MNQNIEKYAKYVNLFIDTRSNKIKNIRHFINEETKVTYSYSKVGDEGIFCFYTNKSTLNFIKRFSEFRKKDIPINGEIKNLDNYYYNEFLRINEFVDPIADNFRNTKLINPFRNYKTPDSIKECKDKISMMSFDFEKKKIYLHSGFVFLFNSISSHFFNILSEAKKDPEVKRIIFIGHSIGAAIGRIAFFSSIIAHPDYSNKIDGYFFGSPKVGNSAFENIFEKFNGNQYYLENDFVSEMPSNKLGFAVPKKRYIEKNISFISENKCDSYTYAKVINYIKKKK